MIKPKAVPPSADLMRLADQVNTRLCNGAKIDFFHRSWPDGNTKQIGVQFSFMGRTTTRIVDTPPDQEDIDKLVRQINSWVDNVPAASKWTTDQADAELVDWNS